MDDLFCRARCLRKAIDKIDARKTKLDNERAELVRKLVDIEDRLKCSTAEYTGEHHGGW